MTKASAQGLERVEDARKDKEWQCQDARWYMAAAVSLSVLKRFRAGESVGKDAFIAICKAVGIDNWQEIADDIQETELPISSSSTELPTIDPNFVGRENAIAHLNTLVSQGAKLIVIQSPGGVGKTTLAKKYLKEKFGDLVIEFPIAKETKDIASVESLIEERLRQLGEEPGREFFVSLERLKQKLQTQTMGVLIDNFEPALDGIGKIVEPHRRYLELLRILARPTVKSVTLITSRELLFEGVNLTNYTLPSLSEQAWGEFFNNRGINTETPALFEIHQAFGGNALAMKILCDPIQRYFNGDITAYWQENKSGNDLLVELAVENLIKEQFNRLQQVYPEAYRLLYRLGCYRYQDVARVPIEGLFCLLWDVPESQRRRVIGSLRDLALIEFYNDEYYLHPVIRAEAISRLRESEDWKKTNCNAAEFWTDSVKTVETIKDALRAFEAYYHYVEIKDFDKGGNVILKRRDTLLLEGDRLGRSFYRLGLLQQMISAITLIVSKINFGASLGVLYGILGVLYRVTGKVNQSLECHKKVEFIATEYLRSVSPIEDTELSNLDLELLELSDLNALLNIGISQIDLWELEAAEITFTKLQLIALKKGLFRVSIEIGLGFVKSCLKFEQQAWELAENVSSKINEESSLLTGYRLFFLGLTYKNLGNIEKAFEIYHLAYFIEQDSFNLQVKGKILYGIAELHQEQREFETALSHHSEAIELLEKIGAKCDLAEAYYQQGLTYQKMSEVKNSQENFDKAIQLFSEMEAPKQIEKVRQAIVSRE
ncbi:MAG: NB-ARC domain-containing protein [Coleofasciculaceae cyanobacterium]